MLFNGSRLMGHPLGLALYWTSGVGDGRGHGKHEASLERVSPSENPFFGRTSPAPLKGGRLETKSGIDSSPVFILRLLVVRPELVHCLQCVALP